ncbi:MAG TPA: hypothetical protein VK110_07785 [Salinisphaeraceae bacterium]|nr:hypothetical protein [Salinisphaeraceae bacterium]
MATTQEQARMVRKQYHLSIQQVRRLERLRDELNLDSEAEVVRRAIEMFDPDALAASERELVEAVARDLLARIHTLNANVEATLARARAARERMADPEWHARVRERTRREAAADPALVPAVATLVGAE